MHESDAGEVLYKDPATGQIVPTDQSKQIAMRDPSDNRIKIFARTPETDEGVISSLGRVAMTGFGAGAPTARPGLALAAQPRPAAATPGMDAARAAERLSATGAPVTIPRAVASDNMLVQRSAATLRNVPGAGDPLVKAADRMTAQLGTKADEITQGFGSGTTTSSGEAARTGIKDWITGTSAQNVQKLYDRVDDLVDPTVTVPLNKTFSAADKIEALRTMAAIKPSGVVTPVMEALLRSEGLTYDGIKQLRTSVRDNMDRGIFPRNMSQEERQAIYEGLTADLRSAVQAGGGSRGLAAFERASNYEHRASQRREALAKIIGSDGNAAPEQVFDSLVAMAGRTSRADVSRLAQGRKAMGAEDWNEFVSGVVARLGRDAGGAFNPQRFVDRYGDLTDAGKSILFRSGGRGDLADFLEDISTISRHWKDLQRFANPSGTGQALAGMGIGAGVFADPLTTLGAVLTGRVLATALAKPATAASIAQWSRAYRNVVARPSPSTLASINIASRNLANTLGDKLGANINPVDLLRSIYGPVKTSAEEE